MRLESVERIFTCSCLLYQTRSRPSLVRFGRTINKISTRGKRGAVALWVISFGLIPVCALGQTTGKIPFTPAGIKSMPGKNICDLQGEFTSTFGVYLNRAKRHAVAYRGRDDMLAVFLLSRPTPHCGMVDAALDLTPVIRKDENIEFKCYTDHEGGTTADKWGHVIGLADNQNGLKRFVKARVAWRVDIKKKRFERITGQPVTCDTSGYAD